MELLIWLIIMVVINSVFGGKNKKPTKRIPGNPNIPGRPGSVELPEMPEESPRSHRVDDFTPESFEPEGFGTEFFEPEYSEPKYGAPEYIEPEYIEPEYIEPEYVEPKKYQPEYVEPEYQQPKRQRPRVKVYGSLGDMLMDLQKGLAEMEAAQRPQQQQPRRNRQRRRAENAAPVPAENTGHIGQTEQIKVMPAAETQMKAAAAQPVVLAAGGHNDKPVADLTAVRQDMQLSEVQAGLLWQEILDKPVALRRGARR